jgi:nucleoside-diphosphate-sugar epimerase
MILVTRATRTVGTELVRQLVEAGVRPRVLVRDPAKLGAIKAKIDVASGISGDPKRSPATGHFDQAGRFQGTVTVEGETLHIECFSMRDRTWGFHRSGQPAVDRRAAVPTPARCGARP